MCKLAKEKNSSHAFPHTHTRALARSRTCVYVCARIAFGDVCSERMSARVWVLCGGRQGGYYTNRGSGGKKRRGRGGGGEKGRGVTHPPYRCPCVSCKDMSSFVLRMSSNVHLDVLLCPLFCPTLSSLLSFLSTQMSSIVLTLSSMSS